MSNPALPGLFCPYLDVRSFAPASYPLDGTRDWQPFIQAAIEHILAQPVLSGSSAGRSGTLYLPPGIYRLDSPLQILGWAGAPASIQIRGDGPGNASPRQGTQIVANFTEWPAIIVHGARGVGFHNLCIRGQNDWMLRPYTPAPGRALYSDAWRDRSLYVYDHPQPLAPLPAGINGAKGYHPIRTNHFSPYAGVAIDPFATERFSGAPGDKYPPPLVTPTGKQVGSAGVHLEGCLIVGFVVGVSIGISGSSEEASSENITLVDSEIHHTRVAIAVGHHKTRNLSARNLVVRGAEYFINCTDYGNGKGNCPSLFAAAVQQTKHLFSTTSFDSTPSINALQCESTLGIGQLMGAGSHDGHVFDACRFNLAPTPPGSPAPLRLATGAPTVFNGCQFATSSAEPMWFVNIGLLTFNSCTFGASVADDSHRFWINGLRDRVAFNDCWMSQTDNAGGVAKLSRMLPLQAMSVLSRTTVVPGCLFYETSASYAPSSLRWVAGGYRAVSIEQVELELHDDGIATFTPAQRTCLRVGDFVWSSTAYSHIFTASQGTSVQLVIGRVTAIDAETGKVTLGDVPECVAPRRGKRQSRESHALGLVRMPMVHLPTTGDIVQGSRDRYDKIIHVATPRGWPSWTSSWRRGDRIRATDPGSPESPTWDIIPEGTYIVNDPPADGFILLSASAAGPRRGIRLFDADVRELSTTPV
jgi:hypothetical protein